MNAQKLEDMEAAAAGHLVSRGSLGFRFVFDRGGVGDPLLF